MAEEFNPRKARAKRPFPVWVDALLADVQSLEADEFGAYMKLLICMWRTENLTISKDPKRLARIAGVSLRLWNSRVSEAILPKLCKLNGGYSQYRVLKEAAYVERQVTLQSNRKLGIKTGKPLKDNDTGSSADTSADTSADDPSYNLQPTLDDEEEERGNNPSTKPDNLTERERVLVAMGHDKSGMTASGRILGSPTDVLEMKRWGSLGLTFDEIIGVVEHTSKQKRGGPAVSFKYFTNAMGELAGLRSAPPLEPTETGVKNNGNGNSHGTPNGGKRSDPALEQILRLSGIDNV